MQPRKKRQHFRKARRSKFVRLSSTSAHKAALKQTGHLKCEVCGWYDPLISPYYGVVVHHIVQHQAGGANHASNYVVLCPNHHVIADKLSRKHKDIVIDKFILISLIHDHIAKGSLRTVFDRVS